MKYGLYICNIIFALGVPFFSYLTYMGTGFAPFLLCSMVGLIASSTLTMYEGAK